MIWSKVRNKTHRVLDTRTIHQLTAGFYEEQKFLEYIAQLYDYASLYLNDRLKTDLIPDAQAGQDQVYLYRIKTSPPYALQLKTEDVSWDYTGEPVYDGNAQTPIVPPDATITERLHPLGEVAETYFGNNIFFIVQSPGIPAEQRQTAVASLAGITLVIDQIVRETFPILNRNGEFEAYVSAQTLHWEQEVWAPDTTLDMLQEYERNLDSTWNSYPEAWQDHLLQMRRGILSCREGL